MLFLPDQKSCGFVKITDKTGKILHDTSTLESFIQSAKAKEKKLIDENETFNNKLSKIKMYSTTAIIVIALGVRSLVQDKKKKLSDPINNMKIAELVIANDKLKQQKLNSANKNSSTQPSKIQKK